MVSPKTDDSFCVRSKYLKKLYFTNKSHTKDISSLKYRTFAANF